MYAEAKSLPDELRTDDIFVRVLEELDHVNADEKMRAILEQRDKEERTRLTPTFRKVGIVRDVIS